MDSSSNICFFLLALKERLLKAYPVHAWLRGQSEIGAKFIHRIWDSLSVALFFPGLPPHFRVAVVTLKSILLVLQARKTVDCLLQFYWLSLSGTDWALPSYRKPWKWSAYPVSLSLLTTAISSQDFACFWLLSSIFSSSWFVQSSELSPLSFKWNNL